MRKLSFVSCSLFTEDMENNHTFATLGQLDDLYTKNLGLYKNLSKYLTKLDDKNGIDEGNSGAYKYILFVLAIYSFSILILMIKYIKREREGSKLEFYYQEFVKRDWYKDKNLYDRSGRRIHFTVDENNKVIKVIGKFI